MRSLLKNILLPTVIRVALAKNAEEGLEQVGKVKPDLIIVDWMMGETTGIDFIKSMRADQKIKQLLLSSSQQKVMKKVERQELSLEPMLFLGKPFNEVELVSLVRNLTRLKENERNSLSDLHHLLVSKMEMEYLMDEIYHQQKNQREILNTIPEALLSLMKMELSLMSVLKFPKIFWKNILKLTFLVRMKNIMFGKFLS